MYAYLPHAHFVLAGQGVHAENATLMQAIAQAGVRANTHLLGLRSDMPALMAALDVLASSYGEAFPNVLGEAMACVVTDVGDSARIIGEVGEVAPPRDADALAAALGRMLTRLETPADLGQQVRERVVAEFSLERMVTRTEQLVHG